LGQFPDEVRERVVLLFEEPETYLHPHLTRKLRSVLERLATTGWTVVTATHAPEMISFASPQHVVRLWRNGDAIVKGELRTTDAGSHAKFQERVDERGGHEMLFSQRVILCEGKDDVFAIRIYLTKFTNLDLDGRSISIINTGDVGALPTYAEMAAKLGILWCAITDEDKLKDGTIKKPTQTTRAKLDMMKTPKDLSIFWKIDLENCLGKSVGKATPEWVAAEIEPKTPAALNRDHPDYAAVGDAVVKWLTV
jgi:predicted ATP-dependent endonuclease of OLD family